MLQRVHRVVRERRLEQRPGRARARAPARAAARRRAVPVSDEPRHAPARAMEEAAERRVATPSGSAQAQAASGRPSTNSGAATTISSSCCSMCAEKSCAPRPSSGVTSAAAVAEPAGGEGERAAPVARRGPAPAWRQRRARRRRTARRSAARQASTQGSNDQPSDGVDRRCGVERMRGGDRDRRATAAAPAIARSARRGAGGRLSSTATASRPAATERRTRATTARRRRSRSGRRSAAARAHRRIGARHRRRGVPASRVGGGELAAASRQARQASTVKRERERAATPRRPRAGRSRSWLAHDGVTSE